MRKVLPAVFLLLALLATAWIYSPGLNGPFVFDDGLNIVSNEHLKLADFSRESLYEAAFSTPNGLFGRPLSMLSFAVNFYLDRDRIELFPSASSFKATNLAIHLLNGIAIFILVRLLVALFRQQRQPELPVDYPGWLALAVSAAWLLHPLNLTGVLYVVQRMASLAALFTFAGLALYVWGRIRLCRGQRGGVPAILAGMLACTPLAVLSKENGILLPFFALAAEMVLFRFETARPAARRFLIVFFVIFAVLPALAAIGYLMLHLDVLQAGYIRRDFTLPERLLTEARVVWFYGRLIVLPSTALMGIFHDDIAVSQQLLEPGSTLPAVLGIFALPLLAWLLRKRQPLVAFGILFFLIGHGLESTVLPLEIAHEHRNYLPMFGLLLGLFHLLLTPLHALSTRLPRRALALLLIPLLAFDTRTRADAWADAYTLWTAEVEHHPTSIRANTAMGDFYTDVLTLDPAAKENNYQLGRHYYEQTVALDRYSTVGLFGLIRISCSHGKPVDQAWLDDLAYSLEHEVLPLSTNDYLRELAICRMNNGCPLSDSDVSRLMHAPLHNSRVVGRDRVLIYSALSFYLFRVAHDNAAAIAAARSAIELDPQGMEQRLWLATVLIAMHRTDEAREQLELLKRLDPRNMSARDIALLEKEL